MHEGITLMISILEVSVSNLRQGIEYSEIFRGFLSPYR
jgi:hypothetical protein